MNKVYVCYNQYYDIIDYLFVTTDKVYVDTTKWGQFVRNKILLKARKKYSEIEYRKIHNRLNRDNILFWSFAEVDLLDGNLTTGFVTKYLQDKLEKEST